MIQKREVSVVSCDVVNCANSSIVTSNDPVFRSVEIHLDGLVKVIHLCPKHAGPACKLSHVLPGQEQMIRQLINPEYHRSRTLEEALKGQGTICATDDGGR